MRVMFINNGGGGYAHYVETDPGITIDKFLSDKLPGYKPGDLLIRVNRLPVPQDYILQENDRVSATPLKIEGA